MAVPIPTKFKIYIYKQITACDPEHLYIARVAIPQEKRELTHGGTSKASWEHVGWRWTMFMTFRGSTEQEASEKANTFMTEEIERMTAAHAAIHKPKS